MRAQGQGLQVSAPNQLKVVRNYMKNVDMGEMGSVFTNLDVQPPSFKFPPIFIASITNINERDQKDEHVNIHQHDKNWNDG